MSGWDDMLALESIEAERTGEEAAIRDLSRIYRASASRSGVEFIGIVEKHWIALFQDPLTGSSFAVKVGESVESGIRRVRERFGLL